jgi:hypothetical protein
VIQDDIDEDGLKYIEMDGNKQKLRKNLLGFFQPNRFKIAEFARIGFSLV